MRGKLWVAGLLATAGLAFAASSATAGDTFRLGGGSSFDVPAMTLGQSANDSNPATIDLVRGRGGRGGFAGGGRGGFARGGYGYRGGYRGYGYRGYGYRGYRGYGWGGYGRAYGYGYRRGYYRPYYGLYYGGYGRYWGRPYYGYGYGYGGNGYGYGYGSPVISYSSPYPASSSYGCYCPISTSATITTPIQTQPVEDGIEEVDEVQESLPAPTTVRIRPIQTQEATFPYNGGPRVPRPMPKAAPIQPSTTFDETPPPIPPQENRPTFLQVRSSKPFYPAYGELPRPLTSTTERSVLIKGEVSRKPVR